MSFEKVFVRENLVPIIEEHKKNGKSIVFTNGCFDILHIGHASYLAEAAALGDILIVAVNDDASIKRLKGEDRPINSHNDRMALLAFLESTDYIVGFGEDKAIATIELFKPDIYVKGGDLKVDDIPETPTVLSYGGVVKTLSLVEGRSSTNVINKISNK